jgi:hypothetical protein
MQTRSSFLHNYADVKEAIARASLMELNLGQEASYGNQTDEVVAEPDVADVPSDQDF